MALNSFTVFWIPDGIVWQSKNFETYDTAYYFYKEMVEQYGENNVNIYEI